MLSVLIRAWWPVRTGRKCFRAKRVANSSRWLIWSLHCAGVQTPLTAVPLHRAPNPSGMRLWTPPCEKTPYLYGTLVVVNRADMQDGVIINLLWRWRGAYSRWQWVQRWNARIFNSLSGTTAIIDAIMPVSCKIIRKRSLRHNWNWARQRWNAATWCSDRHAQLETEHISNSRKENCWLGVSELFCRFTEKPRVWMCNRVSDSWAAACSLELAIIAQSST